MGVLNFAVPVRKTLQGPDNVQSDRLSFVEHLGNEYVLEREIQVPIPIPSNRNKRKRTKSGSSSSSYYDFRDYGIDQRRKGSRHQRRRQNLLEIGGCDGLDDDVFEGGEFFDNRDTAFTELFQDEEKMRKWEDFVDLTDEEQAQYVASEYKTSDSIKRSNDKVGSNKYLLIDKKLRDMIKHNKPAANDLLKYYEDLMDDILSPAILLLSVESAYDRMMVYAICQYMALTSTTIKMKTSTIIEVVLEGDWVAPNQTLTNYLRKQH